MKLIYSVHRLDVFMFTWLITAKGHTQLAFFCKYLSKTADGPLYGLLLVYLYWIDGLNNLMLQVIVLAFMIERPLYFVLKNGFKRNRPQAALQNFISFVTPSDQFSFPSGHTSAAFMMATLISYFMPDLFIPLYLWAGCIGFSRVVLGVHFPTDTFVGMVLGVSVAIFSLNTII